MLKSYFFLIFVSLQIQAILCIFSLENIQKCVESKLKNRNFKKVGEDPFSLTYGNMAVEIFNVISPYQSKQLQYLAECIKAEDSSLFQTSEDPFLYYEYGGSNVTYMTGILPKVFPDIYRSIIKQFSKHATKVYDLPKGLGIRQIAFLSFDKEGMKGHLDNIKSQKEELERNKYVFAIGSVDQESEKNQQNIKAVHESLHKISPFIHYRSGSKYSLIMSLSDRMSFYGGEIMIKRKNRNLYHHGSKDNLKNDEDEYENEDEDESTTNHVPNPPVEKNVVLVDNDIGPDVTSILDLYEHITPEKFSMIVTDDSHSFGIEEIQYGKKNVLWIELWDYNDAPIYTGRPDLDMGESLGKYKISQEL